MILNNAKSAITFKGATYQKKPGGPSFTFADVSLETALITLTKSKKIIRSEIAGKDGDVIEYIGNANDEIGISGTITGAPGQIPTERVNDLISMLDSPLAIQIICPSLNQKGIHYLVISDSSLPQDPGGIAYQTFTISAVAEKPFQLRIKNV